VNVAARGLCYAYGRTRVLDHLDLDVASGESVAVSGASGCGKTTVLRLIAGLVPPDDGEVELDGRVVSRRDRVVAAHERGIGFAFQRSALWPHMTVARNVAFGLHRLSGAEADDRVEHWLHRVGLDGLADRYPDQLSGGQARRVGLARALAPEPPLLLLDEPLTHLEPELRDSLSRVITEHVARTGATMMYVTHDVTEARSVAPRVLQMASGKLTSGREPVRTTDGAGEVRT
jgi:iron(III) transport system ATP-binding protein